MGVGLAVPSLSGTPQPTGHQPRKHPPAYPQATSPSTLLGASPASWACPLAPEDSRLSSLQLPLPGRQSRAQTGPSPPRCLPPLPDHPSLQPYLFLAHLSPWGSGNPPVSLGSHLTCFGMCSGRLLPASPVVPPAPRPGLRPALPRLLCRSSGSQARVLVPAHLMGKQEPGYMCGPLRAKPKPDGTGTCPRRDPAEACAQAQVGVGG